MTKKIAIVGTAHSKAFAPWDDTSWQLWSLNHTYWDYARTDRHFDLHHPDRIRAGGTYFDWLRGEIQRLVMLAEPMEELPAALTYPKEEIMERFGDFFTNSVSWMIALALHEGAEEIGLYGVDMAMRSEYEYQRPSVLYFIGLARGMDVKVTLPPYEQLFKKDRFYWLL